MLCSIRLFLVLQPASVAQLDARPPGRQHTFVEIEIFSTVILSLPPIQEGQLSVSGPRKSVVR